MDFVVSDRASVEEGLLVRSSYVVISIRDPDRAKARVRRQSGLRGVLCLAFHDAEPSERMALPEGVILMTEEHARLAWAFVRRWAGQVGAVVVHCEQGMSRSPAVAAALCRSLGGDDGRFFRDHQPNRLVYDRMLRCADGDDDDARAEA